MRFILMGPWPCRGGALCVPAGTVLAWEPDPQLANAAGLPTAPQWRGRALPLTMPLDARALDQESANALADWYPDHNHLLHTANGIKPKRSFNI
jgi:hypothetical protein